MKNLLIATRNEGKFKEIKKILSSLDLRLYSLNDFKDIPEIKEDGTSFEENSIKKAKEAARLSGILTLADDSGLEVKALDGKPGIYSARFSGTDATDKRNIKKLIGILKDVIESEREAQFQCVVTLANKNKVLAKTTGMCKGKIILMPKGKHGFGYDPVFIPQGYDKTFAELGPEIKNKISHRAKAFGRMAKVILELDKTKGL